MFYNNFLKAFGCGCWAARLHSERLNSDQLQSHGVYMVLLSHIDGNVCLFVCFSSG